MRSEDEAFSNDGAAANVLPGLLLLAGEVPEGHDPGKNLGTRVVPADQRPVLEMTGIEK